MRTTLTEPTLKTFMTRFASGYDSVVRGVNLIYPYSWFTKPPPPNEETLNITLLLSVVDQSSQQWCNLHLSFSDVQEFHIYEREGGYYNTLSDGLRIAWLNGLVYTAFSNDGATSNSLDSFKSAKRYVAARELSWKTEPYDR